MNIRPNPSPDADDTFSALADGALQGDAFAAAMQRLSTDDEARARWHAYHLVGDVMRSADLAGGHGDQAFLSRLEARLALEPAPTRTSHGLAGVTAPLPATVARPAANADVFRWKLAAGFASLAAVAAIGWQALQLQAPAPGAVLAQSQSQPSVPAGDVRTVSTGFAPATDSAFASATSDATPVMLRNAQLDELLAAHSRAVGGAALQSQARSLRNVSDESAR